MLDHTEDKYIELVEHVGNDPESCEHDSVYTFTLNYFAEADGQCEEFSTYDRFDKFIMCAAIVPWYCGLAQPVFGTEAAAKDLINAAVASGVGREERDFFGSYALVVATLVAVEEIVLVSDVKLAQAFGCPKLSVNSS